MPITRTIVGLIYLDALNEQNGWTPSRAGAPYTGIDSGGHEGNYFWATAFGTIYASGRQWWQKVLDTGSVNGRRAHVWHRHGNCAWSSYDYPFAILDSSSPYNPKTGVYCNSHHADWQHHAVTLNDGYKGVQLCAVAYTYTPIGAACEPTCHADLLLICKSDSLTVDGLIVGQKVEVYRASDNTKLGEDTVGAGETSAVVDLSAEIDIDGVPGQMYIKVYGTNGTTLIETTASYSMCGGDTWTWTAGAGTLTITVDADTIYRSAATGTPKTCNVTANLKTLAGANYPGATIYFSTTLGSVSPASDVTDASGNAETALTSVAHGMAVMEAKWLGDATVPACSAYYVVHVFYEAEAGDSDKGFQFYVEGIEYIYCGGKYKFNEEGKTETFEVEIPEWLDTITKNGLVSIYRKGVKEFAGIFKTSNRTLSDAPRVVLRGSDVSLLLDTRVVDTQIYASKTPQYIIDDLLDKFPCGITAGSLGANPDTITITVETESLLSAIQRITNQVGWVIRINVNRTLDFAENFTGGNSSATFTEGDNIFDADRLEDYYSMKNYIRMKGDGVTSTKQDGTRIKQYGLLQAPAYQKKIATQATLDIACQAALDLKKDTAERIGIEVRDDYAVGTFACEDSVTVTSPKVGLSGPYTVKSIERDMSDANFARLELSNRSIELWELDETYRRMTKDANV